MPAPERLPSARLSRTALALGLAALAVLLLLRLLAPDDFDAHDQAKQGLYVVDAWTHGHWLVPMEGGATYPTKPPLMTWLSLAIALVQGRVTELGARAPSFLAAALALVATLRFARRLGETASFGAAFALVANTHVIACAALARTDMLLCAGTTFAVGQLFESYAAFREGTDARRKFLFAAALAGVGTVAKSPVALGCPVAALLVFAAVEPEARAFVKKVVGPALPYAIVVYLAIVGSWFVPAALTAGRPFVGTLWAELAGHVAGTGAYAAKEKAQPFWYPMTHLTAKFLPWTLVPVAAWLGSIGRTRPRPAERSIGDDARTFALCALAGSLAFFAAMRIKRPDHVLPCYPWAACLVGWVVADWAEGRLPRAASKLVTGAFRATGVVALATTVVLPIALRGGRLVDAVPARLWPLDRRAVAVAMLDSLAARPGLVLGLSLLAAPVGALVWAAGRGRRPRLAVAGAAAIVALILGIYDHALSESVIAGKAVAVARFAAVLDGLRGGRPVSVHVAPPSLLFFLNESRPFCDAGPGAARELDAGAMGVVTGEWWVGEIRAARPDLVAVRSSAYFRHNDLGGRLVLLVPPSSGIEPEDPRRGVALAWWWSG